MLCGGYHTKFFVPQMGKYTKKFTVPQYVRPILSVHDNIGCFVPVKDKRAGKIPKFTLAFYGATIYNKTIQVGQSGVKCIKFPQTWG